MLCEEMIYDESVYDFIIKNSEYLWDYQPGMCNFQVGGGFTLDYQSNVGLPPFQLQNYPYSGIPKCYTVLQQNVLEETGVLKVRNQPNLDLQGEGVLIGIIDGGIDLYSKQFWEEDYTTRIQVCWNQSQKGGKKEFVEREERVTVNYGTLISKVELEQEEARIRENNEIAENAQEELKEAETTHGTALASIAAGKETFLEGAGGGFYSGVAPKAELAIVTLKKAKTYLRDFYFIPEETPIYEEGDIMAALDFLDRFALAQKKPLVVCLGLGTSYGSHGGTSALCQYLDEFCSRYGRCVVCGTGNEGNESHHFYGKVPRERMIGRPQSIETEEVDFEEVEFVVEDKMEGFVMEQWALAPWRFTIELTAPTGEKLKLGDNGGETHEEGEFYLAGTKIEIDSMIPEVAIGNQLIFFRITRPLAGVWKLLVRLQQGTQGSFHIYLPMKEMLQKEVRFLRSSPENTLVSPSDSRKVISTGSYQELTKGVLLSSGRGYTIDGVIKPDFVAPGYEVQALGWSGKEKEASEVIESVTGSSASIALVSGCVALIMEWFWYRRGQVRITTAGIKNFMIQGCEQQSQELYPNRSSGYGSIQLYDSFLENALFLLK